MTMRVAAVVAAILLGGTAPALAQGFSMGAKGGVNFADVKFDKSGSTSARWFPVAGVFVTLPARFGVTLQPEALYSVKGASLDTGGAPTSVLIDYLEVPVLARISMTAFGRRVYVAGGPAFGLRLRARTRSAFTGVTEEIDISDDVKRFDLGVAGGGGVEFGALVVDARYTFGLTDIDADKTDGSTARNRVLSLTAGWRF